MAKNFESPGVECRPIMSRRHLMSESADLGEGSKSSSRCGAGEAAGGAYRRLCMTLGESRKDYRSRQGQGYTSEVAKAKAQGYKLKHEAC